MILALKSEKFVNRCNCISTARGHPDLSTSLDVTRIV